ncbi:hypothetical protein ABZZ37_13515 [Streptomyces sp. NPDC006464]|uniref:hypothetical protein n=1 Tax=unclassified Streptomyces TaxID=2593676 RepID=UPI0033BC3DF8
MTIEGAATAAHGGALTARVIEVVRRDPAASALAYQDGLVHRDTGSYTALFRHDEYGPRMRRHAAHCFDGAECAEYPF